MFFIFPHKNMANAVISYIFRINPFRDYSKLQTCIKTTYIKHAFYENVRIRSDRSNNILLPIKVNISDALRSSARTFPNDVSLRLKQQLNIYTGQPVDEYQTTQTEDEPNSPNRSYTR